MSPTTNPLLHATGPRSSSTEVTAQANVKMNAGKHVFLDLNRLRVYKLIGSYSSQG